MDPPTAPCCLPACLPLPPSPLVLADKGTSQQAKKAFGPFVKSLSGFFDDNDSIIGGVLRPNHVWAHGRFASKEEEKSSSAKSLDAGKGEESAKTDDSESTTRISRAGSRSGGLALEPSKSDSF